MAMAPLPLFFTHTSFLLLASLLFASSFFVFTSSEIHNQQSHFFLARRSLLEKTHELENIKSTIPSSKNHTKITKTPSSSKNQTKTLKPTSSNSGLKKNQTKLINPISSKNKTKNIQPNSSKNVGAPSKLKLNSTKPLDPIKSTKTKSSIGKTDSPDTQKPKSISDTKNKSNQSKTQKTNQKQNPPTQPTWLYQDEEEDDDFLAGIKDLPTKFHKTFVPDLHRISTTSRLYLTKANKEITKTYIKPYVGNKYASAITTAISCAFIIIPFLLVSLIFNRIKAYFSLQKLVIFIQIYLSIYFSILCLSSLITGLEPLRFFYATSQPTYIWLQVLQTLGYVMYLLMLLMYLVLVFSTESGLGQKFLGLAQTFVGFAVGLHYYITVFHRVVLRQPPKTNWKIHGIYATCFLVICLLTQAERRKKTYFQDGGEEGKQS
ncbi:unnamed protein product [Amaranthus hypochondriacus]